MLTGIRYVVALLLLCVNSYAEFKTLAVYSDPDKASDPKISVGEWELPDNPSPGYIRVKMVRSEICNSDRRVMAGTKTADVFRKKIVLGHEGIGTVFQLPETGSTKGLQVGDLVLLKPHYVENDDPMLRKGLPNLSPKMKHLGIHINGVFANHMDFPEYNVHKLEDAPPTPGKSENREGYYDQMVMVEPLACVRRGYELLQKQDYFKKDMLQTVLIIGAGPMGVIHAVHLKNKYPGIKVEIYDIDPLRRRAARNIKFIEANVIDQYEKGKEYDLVITATSNQEANTKDSVKLVRNNGVILLFSGIDMRSNEAHPFVGPVDIENVHRHENSVRLVNYDFGDMVKSIHFIGTSGYVTDDIDDSIRELTADFLRGDKSVYKDISTTRIVKLDSKTAMDVSGIFQNALFDSPAIINLLKLYNPEMKGIENVHNYLKIIIAH